MRFLDEGLYIFTIMIIFTGLILLLWLKRAFLIFKFEERMRHVLLTIVLINTFIFIIYEITRGGWHHILFTDLCPFVSVASLPALINGKQKWYKAMMPWLIVGSVITMSISHPEFVDKGFVGGMTSYLRHLMMLLEGLLFLFLIKKYEKADYRLVLIVPPLLLVWILTAALIPWQVTGDVKWAVYSTAVLEPSYYQQIIHFAGHTEISQDYKIFSQVNMPYPLPSILFYIVTIIINEAIAWTTPFFATNKEDYQLSETNDLQKIKESHHN